MIDLSQSRRTEYTLCKFWSVDNNEYITPDQLCHNEDPTGYFYARQETPKAIQNQIMGGVFMTEQQELTIFTNDNIITPVKLKENDLVEFCGEIYRVSQVQYVPNKKQMNYLREISHSAYISLRG